MRGVCGAGMLIEVFTQALGWVTIHTNADRCLTPNSLDAEIGGCALLVSNWNHWVDTCTSGHHTSVVSPLQIAFFGGTPCTRADRHRAHHFCSCFEGGSKPPSKPLSRPPFEASPLPSPLLPLRSPPSKPPSKPPPLRPHEGLTKPPFDPSTLRPPLPPPLRAPPLLPFEAPFEARPLRGTEGRKLNISRFFCPSPATIFVSLFFLPSLGVLSWNFGGV